MDANRKRCDSDDLLYTVYSRIGLNNDISFEERSESFPDIREADFKHHSLRISDITESPPSIPQPETPFSHTMQPHLNMRNVSSLTDQLEQKLQIEMIETIPLPDGNKIRIIKDTDGLLAVRMGMDSVKLKHHIGNFQSYILNTESQVPSMTIVGTNGLAVIYQDFEWTVTSTETEALTRAVLHGCTDTVQYILENYNDIDVATCRVHELPVLHAAVTHNHLKIACLFLDKGLTCINSPDNENEKNTPLHCAIQSVLLSEEERLGAVKFLLQYKPELNIQNRASNTPLDCAIHQCSHEIILELMKAGARMDLMRTEGDSDTLYSVTRVIQHMNSNMPNRRVAKALIDFWAQQELRRRKTLITGVPTGTCIKRPFDVKTPKLPPALKMLGWVDSEIYKKERSPEWLRPEAIQQVETLVMEYFNGPLSDDSSKESPPEIPKDYMNYRNYKRALQTQEEPLPANIEEPVDPVVHNIIHSEGWVNFE